MAVPDKCAASGPLAEKRQPQGAPHSRQPPNASSWTKNARAKASQGTKLYEKVLTVLEFGIRTLVPERRVVGTCFYASNVAQKRTSEGKPAVGCVYPEQLVW